MMKEVEVFNLPDCHTIKTKLVKRYLICRLRIYAQFQAPTKENMDFSSKSGIIKQLIRQVRHQAGGAKKTKAPRRSKTAAKSRTAKKSKAPQRSKAPPRSRAVAKAKAPPRSRAAAKAKAP